MHCPNCGQKTSAELKFCRSCGMKLDSVARAVSEHLDSGQGPEPLEPQENESDARVLRNFVYAISTGFVIVFIGAAMAVLGKQISSWVTTAGALLALLGVFVAIFGAMYPVAVGVKKDLRRAAPKREPKREMEESSAGELPPGDDFEPARPAPSVTEDTTRNLGGEKTKVIG